jgi:hypothetical protein
MTALVRTISNCKRQTHALVREDGYIRTIIASKNTGRGAQGAWGQDELIGAKPAPV